MPEEQANAFRDFSAIQAENYRKELATKGDIQFVRLEMKEMEMRLTEKIESGKHDTLKWLNGLLLAQSALLVTVFAWLK